MKSVFVVTAAAAALLAGSAGASTIYDNGPINGTITGWTLNFGFAVADSFTVSSTTSAWDMSFGTWNFPGESLQSVDWAIYDGNPFTGSPTLLGSGTATAGNNFVSTNGFGYNLYTDTISLGGVALTSGTYWVELSGAISNTGDPIYWDENDGPSSAWENPVGSIGSESFSIGTPEPATWALMLAGFAGLGAALRSRRKFAVA
jgi:hypothetical protein